MPKSSRSQNGDGVALWERRYKAFDLYKAGNSNRAIAALCSVSPATSSKDVKAVLEELKPSEGDVERIRLVQNARYSALLLAVWPEALEGNLAAVDRAEKLMRGINIINGINKAPTGLPGGEIENPMWVSMAQLAREIPQEDEVVVGEGQDVTDLDEALAGMYLGQGDRGTAEGLDVAIDTCN